MVTREVGTLVVLFGGCLASLFVQRNEIRTYDDLGGLWTFVRETSNTGDIGIRNGWFEKDLDDFKNHTMMPVPCAYNDLSTEAELRDHVGWVWYQKKEIISKRDADMRLFLRFESAQYFARVYFNQKDVGYHIGGHLPFEFEVTDLVKFGAENVITVAKISRYPPGFFKMVGLFDFFNYAGLLRTVYLEKRPKIFIEDITIYAEHLGSYKWTVALNGSSGDEVVALHVIDADGKEVSSTTGLTGSSQIPGAKPWWPRGMGDPNLYTLRVELKSASGALLDVYNEEFGFRTVKWDSDQIYINDKPFYCLGFGMHEDFEIHGRGYDQAVMTKDLNLFEWMHGNCYRTSHYPYAQERIREGDRRGIAVILETPAVGLKGFPKMNQLLHQQFVEEMIRRDKNHPSVFMWSIANEPHSEKKEARNYFKGLIDRAHALDPTRPVTIVYGPSNYDNDQTADLLDVVCVNRYYGWYIDMGFLDNVNRSVTYDLMLWKEKFGKAILVTEYGADSLDGLTQEPAVDFSEQYQDVVIRETHKAFDTLRAQKVITGEMIWNFADFMTGMSTTRAVGNHKGVFTRNRQPKIAAYTLRKRYESLFKQ
ncbi:unnamed protein product, partial [Mesorhabditis spiculigera]